MLTRRIAITVAVIGFFALAIMGWCSGLTPYVCGMRALGGMTALYVMMRLASWVVVHIVADAIVRTTSQPQATKDRSRASGN